MYKAETSGNKAGIAIVHFKDNLSAMLKPFVLMSYLIGCLLLQKTGVKGTISPIEAVRSITLFSAIDTIRSVYQDGNRFMVPARPGQYQLLIQVSPDYKPIQLPNVVVEAGRMTDIGDLTLQKSGK